MTRTVLSVSPFGMPGFEELVAVRIEKTPFVTPQQNDTFPLPLLQSAFVDWTTPEAVRQRGVALRNLLRQHPGVAGVLDQLATAPVGSVSPLFVKLSEGETELISWETLCDQSEQFIALDQRWPIGRISDPATARARPPSTLTLPIRLLVVISAFGVHSQAREWELFRDAVLQARAAGVPVWMRVLISDPDLYAQVTAEIQGGLQDVELGPIEKTSVRMVQEIIRWEPNIVHFFCHGTADGAEQSLELATAADVFDPTAVGGSVTIQAKQLSTMAGALPNPWLLALNCCSSGKAAKELPSMAHQVVAAALPAAVAMVEPVAADDAHEFTQAFYAGVFRGLRSVAAQLKHAPRVSFEWADAMFDARSAIDALHAHNAGSNREWALPVLYVRGLEPLSFERAAVPEPDAAEHRLRARYTAEWLRNVGEEMPVEQRSAVMQRMLSTVPARFWPTIDGQFSDE